MEIKETEKAYLAGLVDGEGTITVQNGGKNLRMLVIITNTNLEILNFVKDRYGGFILKMTNDGTRKRDCFNWRLVSKGAINFIKDIYPYLIIKKKHADLAIMFQKTVKDFLRSYGGRRGRVPLTIEQRNYRQDIKDQFRFVNLR